MGLQPSVWQKLLLEKQSSVANSGIRPIGQRKASRVRARDSETFEDIIDRSSAIFTFVIRVPEGWCKKGLVGCGMIGLNIPRLGQK
jgi:hypothetical protein